MEQIDNLAVDLKTERGNLSGGLPGYLRIVPIAFYATVLGSIALIVYFTTEVRNLAAERDREMARQQDQVIVTDELAAERNEIVQENIRAESIAKWIETGQGLQPLVSALARSVDVDASIDTLSLKRNPEMPAQIAMVLRLNGDVSEQIELSMKAVRDLNYRPFSANQKQGDGILDYDASLIWNGRD